MSELGEAEGFSVYEVHLDKYINEKLSGIAERLPKQVHEDPASFACGYNVGYKQAMLDLERWLDRDEGEI